MLDRDIPTSIMFQDRIPYHSHRDNSGLINHINRNHFNFNIFSFQSQKSNILESLKINQNASYLTDQIIEKLKQTQIIQTKDSLSYVLLLCIFFGLLR